MNAIRVKTHIQSETLYLPQLKSLIGKDVEIIVLEDSPQMNADDKKEDARRTRVNTEIGRSFDRKKVEKALRRAAKLRAKASPDDLNDE